MITTVRNYGNNLGIQIPKSLWQDVHIYENDNVEIRIRNNAIVIERQESKKHLSTKERIALFFDKPTEIDQLSEMDWGMPQGKEVW